MTLGLSGSYAVAETPEQVEAAMADPVGTLADANGPGGGHLVPSTLTTSYSGGARGTFRANRRLALSGRPPPT